MRRPPLPLLIGVVVVAVLGVVAAGALSQVTKLQAQAQERQQMIATLNARTQELEQELTAAQAARRDVESRLGDVRNQLASSGTELGRLRSSTAELQGRMDALSGENDGLQTKVRQLKQERDEVEERARRLQEDKSDLERAAARMRDRFTLLDRDYQRLVEQVEVLERERTATPPPPGQYAASPVADDASTASSGAPTPSQTVELPPIVVHKESGEQGGQIRGRLIEVNPSHQFVVIDAGGLDGVTIGMSFEVMRGAQRIGRVRTVRVRPELAACDVLEDATGRSFQVGDVVVQDRR